jgi:glucose-1-phosphate cytidylyltransferase
VKVVLFCGGQGLRLRDVSETIPKPMIPIGYRPVLWHVMRYYAHFGHCEFVLCLGYKADVIKDYFLRYNEALSNDFILTGGGRQIELISRDIEEWTISFIDTGLRSNIAQRLMAVRPALEGEEMFLANYGDVVTDAPLDAYIEAFRSSGKVAAFLSVRPTNYTFHVVKIEDDHVVTDIEDIESSDLWINGGYFIFRPQIFDYIRPGEELVVEPFQRLIAERQLLAYRYEGFWAPMDTLKDVQRLETFVEEGQPPWAIWQPNRP